MAFLKHRGMQVSIPHGELNSEAHEFYVKVAQAMIDAKCDRNEKASALINILGVLICRELLDDHDAVMEACDMFCADLKDCINKNWPRLEAMGKAFRAGEDPEKAAERIRTEFPVPDRSKPH